MSWQICVSHIDPSGILLLIRVQGRKAIVIASHDPPVEPARRSSHHRRLLSEAMGRSGRAAIQARIEGATDPAKLAGARLGRPCKGRSSLTVAVCCTASATDRRAECRACRDREQGGGRLYPSKGRSCRRASRTPPHAASRTARTACAPHWPSPPACLQPRARASRSRLSRGCHVGRLRPCSRCLCPEAAQARR